jgi:hypothetical protein
MEVRRHCGFRDFGDLGAQFRLNRWLYALCRTGTDRPGILFDRVTTWLIAQKVLLPAEMTLERHVARLRSRIEERVWKILTAAASLETRSKLESLLLVADGGHLSLLDRDPTAFARLTNLLRDNPVHLNITSFGLTKPSESKNPSRRLVYLMRSPCGQFPRINPNGVF